MPSTESPQAAVLLAEWQRCLALYRRDGDYGPAEQEAYDELVDYVEAHDLNSTRYDPR